MMTIATSRDEQAPVMTRDEADKAGRAFVDGAGGRLIRVRLGGRNNYYERDGGCDTWWVVYYRGSTQHRGYHPLGQTA